MTTGVGASTCTNCGDDLNDRFCGHCGQKAGPVNPTLRDVVTDVADELFTLDGKLVRSVVFLIARPGFLTREMFSGRRQRSVRPLRLYLVFSLCFFAASAFYESTKKGGPLSDEDISELQQVGMLRDNAAPEEMRNRFVAVQNVWVPRAMFVLVPIAAVVLQVVARGSGRNYPQHLYAALHLHAAFFALGAAASLLYATRVSALIALGIAAEAGFVLWYLPVAYYVAYGGSRVRAVLRAWLALVVYFVIVSAVLLGVLLLVVST